MNFVVATVEFFESLGFNTSHWRKSVDETKTICHLEYAEILVNNLEDNPNVKILNALEARDLTNSEEWSK